MIRTPRPATETALDIVTDPALFADHPSTLAAAWATLMEARGQRVDLDRIGPPAHLVERPRRTAAQMLGQRAHRIRDRITAHKARIGAAGPAPLILNAAVHPGATHTPIDAS